MSFWRSKNWAGISALSAIIIGLLAIIVSPWLSTIFSEKSVKLLMLARMPEVFPLEDSESKLIGIDSQKVSTLVRATYLLFNIGNKALTAEDYLYPITVRATSELSIISTISSLANNDDHFVTWKKNDDGAWQIPPTYLNPNEALIITVLSAQTKYKPITPQQVFGVLKWSGRFKEIEAPQPELQNFTSSSSSVLIWRAFTILSKHEGVWVYVYLALTATVFCFLASLSIWKCYYKIPLLFLLMIAGFVILSFSVADSLLPTSVPGFVTNYWVNYVAPFLTLAIAAFMFFRKPLT